MSKCCSNIVFIKKMNITTQMIKKILLTWIKKKDLDVLNAIEMNLKNNGIGIIDFFNIKKVKNELVENEIIIKKNIKFNITRKANKDFVYKNIKFEDNHRKFNYNESVNALSLKEFEEYLVALRSITL